MCNNLQVWILTTKPETKSRTEMMKKNIFKSEKKKKQNQAAVSVFAERERERESVGPQQKLGSSNRLVLV